MANSNAESFQGYMESPKLIFFGFLLGLKCVAGSLVFGIGVFGGLSGSFTGLG